MSPLSSEQIRRENQNRDAPSITSLKLSLRALSDVSCVSDFKNLERLDLSCNKLSTLEGLDSCINLKWLSVAQNKLKSLKGIEGLSKLTVLNAGQNRLRSMDEVRSLTNLRALILNDNDISFICKVDQLKCLNTLVLSRNLIHDIGDSLLNMKSITKLSLSNCKIQTIGSSLIFCVDLKELRFANNEITTLPTELAQNMKLQNLDLGKNLISKLSDLKVLSALQNLKNLNLQGNPVAEKDKLAKKIKKLVPNLQVFNAKPTERGNRSNRIHEKDLSHPSIDDLPPHNATDLEAEKKAKRNKPKTNDTLKTTSNLGEDGRSELKRKKPGVSENLLNKVISTITVDRNSPFNATGFETKMDREGRKTEKVEENKSEGFDDGETSFMDLMLSESAREDTDKKQRVSEAVPEWELLDGLVVDSAGKKKKKKKKKAKSTQMSSSALQLSSPTSDVGMGGPSTWAD